MRGLAASYSRHGRHRGSIEEAAGFGAANDVEAVACDKGGKPGQSAPGTCVAPEMIISIYRQA